MIEQLEFNFIKYIKELKALQIFYPKEIKDLLVSDCPSELKHKIEKIILKNIFCERLIVKFIWLYGVKKFKVFMEKTKLKQ